MSSLLTGHPRFAPVAVRPPTGRPTSEQRPKVRLVESTLRVRDATVEGHSLFGDHLLLSAGVGWVGPGKPGRGLALRVEDPVRVVAVGALGDVLAERLRAGADNCCQITVRGPPATGNGRRDGVQVRPIFDAAGSWQAVGEAGEVRPGRGPPLGRSSDGGLGARGLHEDVASQPRSRGADHGRPQATGWCAGAGPGRPGWWAWMVVLVRGRC
jgi:hypothetical protein